MYFTGDYGFQNMFLYQPKLSTLQLKRIKALIMQLFGNRKEYTALFFFHRMLLS